MFSGSTLTKGKQSFVSHPGDVEASKIQGCIGLQHRTQRNPMQFLCPQANELRLCTQGKNEEPSTLAGLNDHPQHLLSC